MPKPIPGYDEVGELLQGFDFMAEQLQAQIARQKSLLHDVSHELRSPLARLSMAVGLARQNPAHIAPSLDRIEIEAERLDELIGQILHLSRLDFTANQPTWATQNVVELLASVIEDATFEAQQLGRSLRWTPHLQEWLSRCNADALHSAFENIVRNAIRHTPEGAAVSISCHTGAGHALIIRVEDEGPGLDEAFLGKLFDPFSKRRPCRAWPGPGNCQKSHRFAPRQDYSQQCQPTRLDSSY
ncbi:MAG: hypothetical protein HC848_08695 [Limnobacter sp.]|nr:hypothetical protein [Limnobacter sp.]